MFCLRSHSPFIGVHSSRVPVGLVNALHARLKNAPKNSARSASLRKQPTFREATKFSTNQRHYQDLGSDTSSVLNFCARPSDVISPWGNQ